MVKQILWELPPMVKTGFWSMVKYPIKINFAALATFSTETLLWDLTSCETWVTCSQEMADNTSHQVEYLSSTLISPEALDNN